MSADIKVSKLNFPVLFCKQAHGHGRMGRDGKGERESNVTVERIPHCDKPLVCSSLNVPPDAQFVFPVSSFLVCCPLP